MADGGFPVAAAPGSSQIPSTDVDVALGNPYVMRGVDTAPRTLQGVPQPPSVGPLTPMTGPVQAVRGAPGPFAPASPRQGNDLLPNLASESGRFPMRSGPVSSPYASSGEAPLMPKRHGDEEHVRQTAAYFFTLGLFCLFGPVMIMTVHIGMDPDVGYWIGRLGLFALLTPLYIVMQHLVQLRALKNEKPVSRRFFLIVAVMPTVYFIVTGGIYYSQAKWYANFLDDPKCEGEKKALEKAHQEAWALWNGCVLEEKKKNGGHDLMMLPNLQSCPNFKDEEKRVNNWHPYEAAETALRPGEEWTKEWWYIATVEVNHQCAGWCEHKFQDKPMLFHDPGTPASYCQNFVAHKMLVIEHQGMVVMWVSLLIVALACPVYYLIQGPLGNLGHAS